MDAEDTTDAPRWRRCEHEGEMFDRLVVRTPWIGPEDDVVAALRRALEGLTQPGDTAFISEKLVILTSGGTVPLATVRPGALARFLVRYVRPRTGSRGLSVPEKMQYVLDHAGRIRVLVAAAVSAVTRPFGWHGAFYLIAGTLAGDLDGGRPPYDHLLFPPLSRTMGKQMANHLAASLGVAVAIVDLNDYGGSIRATSDRAMPADWLLALLADNPLGQREAGTPAGLLRPLGTDA